MRIIGRQLLRSGTSIGANYREALGATTKKHFVALLQIALREANETLYWLELLSEAELIKPNRLAALMKECDELVAMLTASVKTAKKQLSSP